MEIMIPAWVDGTLCPVEKLDVHKRGLKHKAVSVFVFCGTELLIQQRALGKYHSPGLWANTCCTHPDWDEAPADCATRRLSDELGMSGVDLTYVEQLEYRADVGNDMIEHEVVDCFIARCATRPTVTPNPDEVMDVRWVEIDTLRDQARLQPEEFTKWFQIYLAKHFDQLFAKSENS